MERVMTGGGLGKVEPRGTGGECGKEWGMAKVLTGIRGVVWDWGDTLMRDIPGMTGPMADWPRVEAMPGALEALNALNHIPVQALATNAEDSDGEAVTEALARVGLREHLTHLFTSREMGVGKPDPAFFREVASRLGIPCEDLLSIGNDYRKDIRPAEGLGMATVWIGTQEVAHPQSLEVEGGGICELPIQVDPDPRHRVVESLQELARIVPSWMGGE